MALRPLTSEKDRLDDRDYLNRRASEMDKEFSTFRSHYKELSDFVAPRRGRYFVTDRNRGEKRHKNIINNRGGLALRRATAGMHAGAMSPSRPWFAFDILDKDILNDYQVKAWLELLRMIVLQVFASSNFYNMSPIMLRELLLFGTGCMTHDDDFDDVAFFNTHTVGSYRLATNSKNRVDTMYREFQMTCYQMVHMFGKENTSISCQQSWDNSNYGQWYTVCHFIELNPFRDISMQQITSEAMPFRSVYYEKGSKNATDRAKFLSRKGYEGFPVYAPRWEVTGEDIYGTDCPGMTNLGDIKQLQNQEKEKAKAIAKASTPPLQGPPSVRNRPVANLPGGMTVNTSTQNKIEAIYNVDPRVNELRADIAATEQRIDQGFFVDLFMAITDMDGIQPKNQLQLSQINEERLLQIGPALEQIHGEWLSRTVSRTIQQILKAGIMPPAPEKLQGKEVDIQFVSALAQAQKSVSIGAIERVSFFVGSLMDAGWDVSDKFDADFAVDEYASLVGSPTRLILPTEYAQQQRARKRQQQAQAENMQMASEAANIAKMAADAKLGDDNVLSRASEAVGGGQ